MRISKFTETQIITILKQGDAGLAVKDLCRQAGISTATYYQWKSKYGGLEASELRRVKDLEAENAKLKRMYAEMALDNAALKDLIAKKLQGRVRSRWVITSLRGSQIYCAGRRPCRGVSTIRIVGLTPERSVASKNVLTPDKVQI